MIDPVMVEKQYRFVFGGLNNWQRRRNDKMSDYEKAKRLGLTDLNRWEEGIDHHPMSERLMAFLAEHDFNDYEDHFCWKVGGDGDNGEALMYQMDAFFEFMDMQLVQADAKRCQRCGGTLDDGKCWDCIGDGGSRLK